MWTNTGISFHDVGLIALGGIDKQLQRIRLKEVIGLENSDILADRIGQPHVHGGAVTRVGLIDHSEASVGLHIPMDDGERAVRRSIVDAQDLEIREGLSNQRVEALLEIALDVANGHQHRYLRRGDASGGNIRRR